MFVNREKTWELRTTSTKIRGPIGIAAKGTGTVIGAVDLVNVHGPFTRPEMERFFLRDGRLFMVTDSPVNRPRRFRLNAPDPNEPEVSLTP